ncbi:unnamed protein product [Moneuplotes crassus]|uniref:Uncharacterized protein n=1 Tax=Euplotes crassus TaxID=5936 RepID=A0AAD2DAG1_EUPCR|nr:unnamed protein product [Moneuplotes crassus]
MSSNIINNPSEASLGIWDGSDQDIEEEECSPQVPKHTNQFRNLLRYNKGRANKDDFQEDSCIHPGYRHKNLRCSRGKLDTRGSKQQIKSRPKRKLKDFKPNTYDAKACATNTTISQRAQDHRNLASSNDERFDGLCKRLGQDWLGSELGFRKNSWNLIKISESKKSRRINNAIELNDIEPKGQNKDQECIYNQELLLLFICPFFMNHSSKIISPSWRFYMIFEARSN